jgi:hypothetical protein
MNRSHGFGSNSVRSILLALQESPACVREFLVLQVLQDHQRVDDVGVSDVERLIVLLKLSLKDFDVEVGHVLANETRCMLKNAAMSLAHPESSCVFDGLSADFVDCLGLEPLRLPARLDTPRHFIIYDPSH